MGAFVYILRCADSSYYVGCATGEDLAPRIAQHNSGFYGGYTSTRRPVQLAWSQHFEQITDAITAERQLKGWSRAKKKEALIRGDWNSVQNLAKRRGGKPRSSS
jgi:putative endonuclease